MEQDAGRDACATLAKVKQASLPVEGGAGSFPGQQDAGRDACATLAKGKTGVPTIGRCVDCAWFKNDPASIEDAFKGLSVLSSGYGSVGAYDGVCGRHGIYLSFRDGCCSFKHR